MEFYIFLEIYGKSCISWGINLIYNSQNYYTPKKISKDIKDIRAKIVICNSKKLLRFEKENNKKCGWFRPLSHTTQSKNYILNCSIIIKEHNFK